MREKAEPFKQTKIDGISYTCPTWDQMGEMSFSLAEEIIESGKEFDRVVALAKGGWTWARTLVDNLGMENMSSTKLKSYDGVNSNSQVRVLQPLVDKVDEERILIFDDVADSGKTLVKAEEYLKILGAKEVSIATLCSKPRSCVDPDYYAFSTESWVIFPHEIREFINESLTNWSKIGIPEKEIRSRFEEIGLPMEQVDYFITRSGIVIK
jgi:uncharacterized protein